MKDFVIFGPFRVSIIQTISVWGQLNVLSDKCCEKLEHTKEKACVSNEDRPFIGCRLLSFPALDFNMRCKSSLPLKMETERRYLQKRPYNDFGTSFSWRLYAPLATESRSCYIRFVRIPFRIRLGTSKDIDLYKVSAQVLALFLFS